jgi:hypothetical protein
MIGLSPAKIAESLAVRAASTSAKSSYSQAVVEAYLSHSARAQVRAPTLSANWLSP